SADAAPARSGGALPEIRSAASVNTGARPSESTNEPATAACSPFEVATIAKPATVSTRPPVIALLGLTARVSGAVSSAPTMNAIADGIDHRPAIHGESASTDW